MPSNRIERRSFLPKLFHSGLNLLEACLMQRLVEAIHWHETQMKRSHDSDGQIERTLTMHELAKNYLTKNGQRERRETMRDITEEGEEVSNLHEIFWLLDKGFLAHTEAEIAAICGLLDLIKQKRIEEVLTVLRQEIFDERASNEKFMKNVNAVWIHKHGGAERVHHRLSRNLEFLEYIVRMIEEGPRPAVRTKSE